MGKYFHEITKREFNRAVKKGLTWAEMARLYPQPKWCGYPDAVQGLMGCWSLMDFMVKNEGFCKGCDCHMRVKP